MFRKKKCVAFNEHIKEDRLKFNDFGFHHYIDIAEGPELCPGFLMLDLDFTILETADAFST